MWLKVNSNNKQPGLVLNHYLQCVHQVGGMTLVSVVIILLLSMSMCSGCPTVLCMDRGTENSRVAAVQYAFRESHTDSLAGNRSFRFGTSPANIVRICMHIHRKQNLL